MNSMSQSAADSSPIESNPALSADHQAASVSDHPDQNDSVESDVQDLPEVDYASYSKAEFAELLKELSQDPDIRKADRAVRQFRTQLDELREQERAAALSRFVEEGGKSEDFSWRPDNHDLVIDGALKLIREKRMRFNREQDDQRRHNLAAKNALLERLREVVELQNAKRGFEEFKKIQAEWNAAGPVPQGENEELWARYHALVDRFFDQRHIYFELLDLDRRKNSEAKTEICIRAERLAENPSLHQTLREINELHQEWKRIGPVVREDKDVLWNRFKAASDVIYRRRAEHEKGVAERHKANLVVREALIGRMDVLAAFESGSIKEWNARSVELQAVRQEWDGAGPIDRESARTINRKFWALFKKFHQKKGQFFKQLDSEREENLRLKRELVARVAELKDSADISSASEEIKALQRKWKEIGPVPDKFRTRIFDEFRGHCDHFFNRIRDNRQEAGRMLEENLQRKQALIGRIASLNGARDESAFRESVREFLSIGHVPARDLRELRERFDQDVERYLLTCPDEDGTRDRLRTEAQRMAVEVDPGAARKIQQEEQQLRRQIQQVENDLAVLKNNLGFFARSKNAAQFLSDFQSNVDRQQAELDRLKSRLKLLRSVPLP